MAYDQKRNVSGSQRVWEHKASLYEAQKVFGEQVLHESNTKTFLEKIIFSREKNY